MVLPTDQERVARPRRRAAVRAAALGSRAPFCIQAPACPRSQPRDPDELQGLREEEAAAAVQAEAPGREGYKAEGRASYQRPAATALGGRPAPPTWRPPPRLREGSIPARPCAPA